MIEKIKECIYPIQDWIKWHKAKDIDIATYIEDDYFVINFQGSVSKEDWKNNFSFWWKPYKGMNKLFLLHKGFISLYHIVRDDLHKEFLESNKKKIKIRGYSHGAALGIICYADFMWHKENKYEDIELDGFVTAPPRVSSIFGWKEFNRLTKGLKVVFNHNDIVTHVPFFWMLFKHVGEIEVIGKRRKIFWPFTTKRIAQHWYESYMGYLSQEDYEDNEENNSIYRSAYKIMPWINIGILVICAILLLV